MEYREVQASSVAAGEKGQLAPLDALSKLQRQLCKNEKDQLYLDHTVEHFVSNSSVDNNACSNQ